MRFFAYQPALVILFLALGASSVSANQEDVFPCAGAPVVEHVATPPSISGALDSGFQPFLPITPEYMEPKVDFGDPWYINQFGPATGDRLCERRTLCSEVGPEEVTLEDGTVVGTFHLECLDSCWEEQSRVVLHGPTMTLKLTREPTPLNRTLAFKGWAVDRDGVTDLAIYVDHRQVFPNPLSYYYGSPGACETLAEIGDANAVECDPRSGFDGILYPNQLDAGMPPLAPGEYTLTVIALDAREDFPVANRMQLEFTVPPPEPPLLKAIDRP